MLTFDPALSLIHYLNTYTISPPYCSICVQAFDKRSLSFFRAKYHKLKYGTELNQGDMKPPVFEKKDEGEIGECLYRNYLEIHSVLKK